MTIRLLLAITLYLFSFQLYAEPTPTVSALMNQRVSMFTFGMYRLQEYVKETLQDVNPQTREVTFASGVFYDWDRNKIEVKRIDLSKAGQCSGRSETECKEKCRQYLKEVSFFLCTGSDCRYSDKVSEVFAQIGYSERAESTPAKLRDLVHLEVQLARTDWGKDGKRTRLVCEQPLTSDSISYRDK